MPEQQFIIPIRGIKIQNSEERGFAHFLNCSLEQQEYFCKHCESKRLRKKAYVVRELKHALWEGKLVYLHLKVPKFFCLQCHRYFMAPVPGVLPKKRSTEKFRQEIFHLHHGGLTGKHLSITHKVSTATVERWYQDFVAYRVKELQGRSCPQVLGSIL